MKKKFYLITLIQKTVFIFNVLEIKRISVMEPNASYDKLKDNRGFNVKTDTESMNSFKRHRRITKIPELEYRKKSSMYLNDLLDRAVMICSLYRMMERGL